MPAQQRLDSRAAVLTAAGNDPFTRMTTAGGVASGYRTERTVAWVSKAPWGLTGYAVGDPEQALMIFSHPTGWHDDPTGWSDRPRKDTDRRREDDNPRDRSVPLRIHLSRLDGETPAHLRLVDRKDWDFRWALAPPPPTSGEERVVRLDERHHRAIDALLDEVLPGSFARPGSPGVRAWYGIVDGDQLVACGADRSSPEVGFLASIGVRTRYQGRGLGAALAAAMTRRLFAGRDIVARGVVWDNTTATRLYERLGFTHRMGRSSASLIPA